MSTSLLCSLTKLHLEDMYGVFDTAAELINGLRSMPRLQELRMHDVSVLGNDLDTKEASHEHNPLILAQLRVFYFSGKVSNLKFIRGIRFPPAASLTIRIRSYGEISFPWDWHGLLASLQDHGTRCDTGPNVRRLECYEDSRNFAFHAYATPCLDDPTPPLLRLIIDDKLFINTERDIDFVGMLQLEHLEVLGLCLRDGFNEDLVTRILKHGHNVSELWLRSHYASKTALTQLARSSLKQGKKKGQSTDPPLLPEVRRIHANLEERRPSQDLLSRLRSLLKQRSRSASGPPELMLVNSRIDKPEEIEKLRTAAGRTELVQLMDDADVSGESYFGLPDETPEDELH
ncbi:hypothetical protein PUNSTDRAFT_135303 [Punctularia strigosozonata HHB-11173 SS5]|uniref:uncharacterized protein n=1 Tax=Punctularia strigosozonata (strain HHB-11173) TaxID=741275 RepID=UPI0004416B6B|nr:uncharacterized protein PUNSTDRAFT_135303 [Punctularia strigosozonata HHB-11173 SS5]EIN07784.1 hypothetical protein PUNSTDRAFT_135303 [Punctularia strigosozonata HHB-11173 SS5]